MSTFLSLIIRITECSESTTIPVAMIVVAALCVACSHRSHVHCLDAFQIYVLIRIRFRIR